MRRSAVWAGRLTRQTTGELRLVIPTRDSARWILPFHTAYRRIGIDPLYVCDSRSRDHTIPLLQQAGAEVAVIEPKGDFLEADMLQTAAGLARTPWVLRIDDDEFPSRRLLTWVEEQGIVSPNPAVYFSRRELFRSDGRIFYSRARNRFSRPDFPGIVHPQLRLFQPSRVAYLAHLHTAGLKDPDYCLFAPHDAFLVHCSALLRSPSERLQKMRAYEAIIPHSCWRLADEYLPELYDLAWHDARRDGLDELMPLFASLPSPPAEPALPSDQERRLIEEHVGRMSSETERAQCVEAERRRRAEDE